MGHDGVVRIEEHIPREGKDQGLRIVAVYISVEIIILRLIPGLCHRLIRRSPGLIRYRILCSLIRRGRSVLPLH